MIDPAIWRLAPTHQLARYWGTKSERSARLMDISSVDGRSRGAGEGSGGGRRTARVPAEDPSVRLDAMVAGSEGAAGRGSSRQALPSAKTQRRPRPSSPSLAGTHRERRPTRKQR